MINLLFKSLFGSLSLLERRLSIVMFHRVLDAPDPLLPDENDRTLFRQRVAWLAEGFNVLTLGAAVERLRQGDLPPRALVITFDDGYADNAVNALPILREAGVPATFFVTTRFLDGGMMWNDRVVEAVRAWPQPELDPGRPGLRPIALTPDRATALNETLNQLKYLEFEEREALADELHERSGSNVRNLMMDASQIRALHDAGMEIGAHTHSHPIMARLGDAALRAEIMTNKDQLEHITGAAVTSFAYPNGRADQDYHQAHTALLEELGFACAVTTMPGTAADLSNRFEIPRFSPWDRDQMRYLARLARNYLKRPAYAATATG